MADLFINDEYAGELLALTVANVDRDFAEFREVAEQAIARAFAQMAIPASVLSEATTNYRMG